MHSIVASLFLFSTIAKMKMGTMILLYFLICLTAMQVRSNVFHRVEAFGEDDEQDHAYGIATQLEGDQVNRRLAEKIVKPTCNKYPQICREKGSLGPDCCKKKCVNVRTDRLHCGKCGYKCRKNEACCRGRCVNLFKDVKNCGRCNKRCKKGDACIYGLCNYA